MSGAGKGAFRWLREPLLHCLLFGGLLFLLYDWLGDRQGDDGVLVSSERIDSLSAVFARTWRRPPTGAELDGLIDDYVREELAAREARALGLDRDDTVIRRRLRQKLEFVAEDSVIATPPTTGELQRWLDEHPDGFRTDPEYAFRQVFLDPAKRGAALEEEVGKLLERLQRAGGDADIRKLGDSLMVPRDIERMSASAIARAFGERFAHEITRMEPGRWNGPVRSGFGVHLVYLHKRRTGTVPPLAEIRPRVERAYLEARREETLDALYAELRQRYPVVIEGREPAEGGAP